MNTRAAQDDGLQRHGDKGRQRKIEDGPRRMGTRRQSPVLIEGRVGPDMDLPLRLLPPVFASSDDDFRKLLAKRDPDAADAGVRWSSLPNSAHSSWAPRSVSSPKFLVDAGLVRRGAAHTSSRLQNRNTLRMSQSGDLDSRLTSCAHEKQAGDVCSCFLTDKVRLPSSFSHSGVEDEWAMPYSPQSFRNPSSLEQVLRTPRTSTRATYVSSLETIPEIENENEDR
ncbi:hypothetical protein FVE85_3582 [Porphyridium purpureum]|uniref:Uncharacterized protein n=1 Tax=Porphyridium purpureum TaxID=35688 RepID=A0A5J4YN66_PORPP|nr:hypothetical protein FVE85_3582 [Porphyridium purpureum]|eukprot:POR7629..scf249_10